MIETMALTENLQKAPTEREQLSAIDQPLSRKRGSYGLKRKIGQYDPKDDAEHNERSDRSIEPDSIQASATSIDSSLIAMSLTPASRTSNLILQTTPISDVTSTSLVSATTNLPTITTYLATTTVALVSSTQYPGQEMKGIAAQSYIASEQPTNSMRLPITVHSTLTSIRGAVGTEVASPDIEAVPSGDPHHASLSPTAQHTLIAAGALGAAVLIAFLTYLMLRFLKIDLLARWRHNKWQPKQLEDSKDERAEFARMPHGRGGISRLRDVHDSLPPLPSLPVSNSPTFSGLTRAQPERESRVPDPLISDSQLSLTTVPGQLPLRNPPGQFIPVSQAFAPADIAPLSMQLPTQSLRWQDARMSDMSSISSGFGDAIIEIEEIPLSNQEGPKSIAKSPGRRVSQRTFGSRFSWTTAPKTPKDSSRDTMYTTMSEESAPRFRSVKSWVNQQSSRLHKERQSQRGSASETTHQRTLSEATNPAFKAHPGQIVMVQKGKRIPSEILDRTFGS